MKRFRTIALLAALAGALAASGAANGAPPKLVGTVGPGFTITLTSAGKPVKRLKAGTYSITVTDKSSIHNFRLRGPGVNREITQIGFVGKKTVVLKLKRGTYTFVCDPHLTIMKGSFKVV
jgi:plastocyanin